ncbi:hypothetical protein KQH54_04115 [bacterium]|nr:hypothetical protein [bacterium]
MGLTISRALHKLDFNTHAIVLIGKDPTGRAYQSLLREENFPISVISVEGQTRSNTILLDTGTNQETQITENAKNILQQDVHLVVELLREYVHNGDTVLLAGPLPSSLSPDVYQWLTQEAHLLGAEVALVTSGKPLEHALKAKPDLVFVLKQELESYFNIPVRDYADVIQSAQQLHEEGAVQVLINIPDEGKSLLLSDETQSLITVQESTAAHLQAATSSGVLEAFVAGFLMGSYQFETLPETLEFSAAAAMYTAGQVGSQFGEQSDVEELLSDVNTEEAPNPNQE